MQRALEDRFVDQRGNSSQDASCEKGIVMVGR
jgi:hypothetical protein